MKTAITIGTFDAVHLGHLALVQAARDAVGDDGLIEVWSFDPPPMTIMHPDISHERLTTIDQRTQLFQSAGVDIVKIITPTQEFLDQTPEEFVSCVVDRTSFSVIVEGEEFRFGKDRRGSVQTLQNLALQFGFECIALPALEISLKDHLVMQASSSHVRWLINEGRVEDAKHMLGRPYAVSGIVEQGDKRGRTLGIHTANLGNIQTMLPKEGIYAGEARVDGQTFAAAISIGTKPTFGQNEMTCEAHLLDFSGNEEEYGWPLTLEFSHWIRNQITFDNSVELLEAIHRDIEFVLSLYRK